jgi:hypothetical protein
MFYQGHVTIFLSRQVKQQTVPISTSNSFITIQLKIVIKISSKLVIRNLKKKVEKVKMCLEAEFEIFEIFTGGYDRTHYGD